MNGSPNDSLVRNVNGRISRIEIDSLILAHHPGTAGSAMLEQENHRSAVRFAPTPRKPLARIDSRILEFDRNIPEYFSNPYNAKL
ncbi:hypothetical protein ACIBQ0_30325 [Nocardia nova]|uniref:hypothetical protein n=1 Tax=Nocardia nova TaxID=37330 RepID=UPI0037A48DF6